MAQQAFPALPALSRRWAEGRYHHGRVDTSYASCAFAVGGPWGRQKRRKCWLFHGGRADRPGTGKAQEAQGAQEVLPVPCRQRASAHRRESAGSAESAAWTM